MRPDVQRHVESTMQDAPACHVIEFAPKENRSWKISVILFFSLDIAKQPRYSSRVLVHLIDLHPSIRIERCTDAMSLLKNYSEQEIGISNLPNVILSAFFLWTLSFNIMHCTLDRFRIATLEAWKGYFWGSPYGIYCTWQAVIGTSVLIRRTEHPNMHTALESICRKMTEKKKHPQGNAIARSVSVKCITQHDRMMHE